MPYTNILLHTDAALNSSGRAARGVISATALITVLYTTTLDSTWAFALTVTGIYTGLTAMIGEELLRGIAKRLFTAGAPHTVPTAVGRPVRTC